MCTFVASTKSDPGFESGFFRIDLNPGVRWIAPKMWWIHYFVGVSHFAKFCLKKQPVTV